MAQNTDGVVVMCAFPENTEVQGHLCRGTGGLKGAQASFYASGALKEFHLARPTPIDNVPCDRSSFRRIVELHENGRLKSCLLGDDFLQGGEVFRKGRRVEFDSEGRVRLRDRLPR